MYLQVSMVNYIADREITNTYENLQIVQSQFLPISYYSFLFGLIGISIGLSIFGLIANEYKRITIRFHLTTCNIRSAIR